MMITTLMVAVTVAVLRLHHADPHDPPPTWLRTLTYKFLVRVTCLQVPAYVLVSSPCGRGNETQISPAIKQATEMNRNAVMPTPVLPVDCDEPREEVRNEEACSSEARIDLENRFIALVVDKFFAGFFLLLFAVGTTATLYIYPAYWINR